MPRMHSICHVSFFHNQVNGRDDFKNDLKKSGTDIGAKLVYGPNREMVQNVGTKSIFTPLFSTALSLIGCATTHLHVNLIN